MNNKVAILFTNDAHCAFHSSDACLGYAGVASCARKLREEYGAARVALVDAGDSLGGGAYGLLSAGQAPLDALNALGYDVYVPGNADFTFGMGRLAELECAAGFPFVCANFVNLSGKPYFKHYVIKQLGDVKVAFVGALSPYTINVMNPGRYLDGNAQGWHFSQDQTGEGLYSAIQGAVDDALAEGARLVVLVSHLGQKGQVDRWRSDAVVRATHGIDIVLDGHSHEVYLQDVPNDEGNPVPVVQAGVSLTNAAVVTVDEDSLNIEVALIDSAEPDASTAARVSELASALDRRLSNPVGVVPSEMVAKQRDGVSWAIRTSETNLGDLVSDAFRAAVHADAAIVPSWTIRDNLPAGTVALGDVCMALPLGHMVSSALLSGRQIADALEYASRSCPLPCGSFAQVSGITFAVDCSVPSPVQTDEEESFLRVDGPRRVSDIRIQGNPIDLEMTYSVAAPSFLLEYGSSGFSMMRSGEMLCDKALSDVDALVGYFNCSVEDRLSSICPALGGEGRITIAGVYGD